MTKRTFAIGDIHGCSLALQVLLESIRPQRGDRIITLGDMIDRGPNTRGVLDQLLLLREWCTVIHLKGNHEQMFLAAREQKAHLAFWLKHGGQEMLQSYGDRASWDLIPPNHLDFIRSGSFYFETPTHIFVHACYDPLRPMGEQEVENLLWDNPDFANILPHVSGKTVVVGHTPQTDGRMLDRGHIQCIDTLCHAGQWLTALNIETGQCIQTNQKGEVRPGQINQVIAKSHRLGG